MRVENLSSANRCASCRAVVASALRFLDLVDRDVAHRFGRECERHFRAVTNGVCANDDVLREARLPAADVIAGVHELRFEPEHLFQAAVGEQSARRPATAASRA